MRKRAVRRLSEDIKRIERDKRRAASGVNEDALTEAEAAFAALAHQRGKKLLRNGWPDFLMTDPDTGGVVGLEVKTGADAVTPAQARMFAALEAHGLRVMVWSPENPTVIVPWQAHKPFGRQGQKQSAGARPPALSRMRPCRLPNGDP